jgi:hypothetical protein
MQSDRGGEVESHDYRAISKAVVFALVLSLAGIAGLLAPLFLVLPTLALFIGAIGVRQVRRYPHELTGAKPGYFAIGLAAVVLVVGSSLHAYEYATEVPDNAQRVAFWELQASKQPGQPRIPPTALQLDGQRIFIKGYVHPSVQNSGMVNQFLMVGDLGLCCYGGQPELTHMIDVRLSGDLKIKYSYRKRALAGILHVDPTPKSADGLQGACYYLEADYLK